MSHYSKLPADQQAKVDAYMADVSEKIRASMKDMLFSQRKELEDAFISRIIDEAAIPRGGEAYTNAAEQLKQMCRNFEVKKERLQGSGEPGHFILRIHKKTKNPCEEIPIATWGWQNRLTLREEETQAILSMADQLDAAQERIKKLEVDVQRWKDEAERWRKIQMREYFSQDSK